MRATLVVVSMLLMMSISYCQTIRFHNNDDYIKVKAGDNIEIKADSAYLVSAVRAESLNSKLDELDEIKVLYNDLADNRKELLEEIKKAHKLLTKLTSHMQGDNVVVSSNLSSLILDLDNSIADFKNNNLHLKQNNNELASKISQLERLVNNLRKETKGLWWNGITDKIISFAAGVGVGAVLVLVL